MGGFVPLGYDVKDRKLVVNQADAKKVRMIFERYIKIGSALRWCERCAPRVSTGKYGKLVDKGHVYKLLNNRVYIGQAVHKGVAYQGEHEAIIRQSLWDKGPQHPRRQSAAARSADASPDARLAEGTDFRTDRAAR